jgi:hypothetical protein
MIYPHTISITKSIRVESSLGGISIEHPGPSVSAAAFVQPQRETLSIVNAIGGSDMVVNIYVPPGTDIEATDQVFFGGNAYEVTGAVNQYGVTGSHHIKAVARLLEPES